MRKPSLFQALITLVAILALALIGCAFMAGAGGNWGRREPAKPNGDGVYVRGGVGFGRGSSRGWVASAAEYRRIGDFHSVGLAVKGGLFLVDPFPSAREPDEDWLRENGRVLGDGITLRGRLAAGGWGAEPDALVIEGGLGVGWDLVTEKAGPGGLALHFSVFRATLDDRDLWSYGINLSATVPSEAFK